RRLFFHDQQLFFFDYFRLPAQLLVVLQPGQLLVVLKRLFLEIHALLPMGNFLTRCSWHAAPAGGGFCSALALCYPTPTSLSSVPRTPAPPNCKFVSGRHTLEAFRGGLRFAVLRGVGSLFVLRKIVGNPTRYE